MSKRFIQNPNGAFVESETGNAIFSADPVTRYENGNLLRDNNAKKIPVTKTDAGYIIWKVDTTLVNVDQSPDGWMWI